MRTTDQNRILEKRASAFALLAEASRSEADLILARKPAGQGTKAGAPEVICAAEHAKLLIEERRRRDRYFSASLFAEPSWDLLLGLFVATARGGALSTTDACAASRAPQATALRHLDALKKNGLVETITVANDNRRRDLRLTDSGLEAMFNYIAALNPRFGDPEPSRSIAPDDGSGKPAFRTPALESLVITQRLAGPRLLPK